MLGYEVKEENRDFEVDGLTGNVRRYVSEDITYPCFIIELGSDSTISEAQASVLKKMTEASDSYDVESEMKPIQVYISEGEKLISFTKVFPLQVRAFLSLTSNAKVIGYVDKDTMLEGNMLYVLAV